MRRVSFIAAVALVSALFGTASAGADTVCPPGTEPGSIGGGTVCIPVVDPGGPGPDNPPGGGGGNGGSDPCSYYIAEPQPPAGTAVWGGHTPDEGSIYIKDCEDGWGGWGFTLVFIPNGAATPPNPATLARRALGQMHLAVPDVHLAPAPPAKTYVGLDTWLWMPPGQWATIRKSITAGTTTVTVTAVPQLVEWDMGPGTKVCRSAGREWKVDEMPKGATTSCSYKYSKVSDFLPDRKFRVTATLTYQVDWTCSGNCLSPDGSLGNVDGLPGTASIRVSERQSVVVGGDD